MTQKTSSAKGLAVRELINCLQSLDPTLPVYFVMFDDGYNITKLTDRDIHPQDLEMPNGERFQALVIGEEWLG